MDVLRLSGQHHRQRPDVCWYRMPTTFTSELDAASSGWLGRIESLGPRATFPLSMRLSECYASQRTVLMGDAAHVVHPLAGQGVNLGFADAAALVESLIATRLAGGDIGSASALHVTTAGAGQNLKPWHLACTPCVVCSVSKACPR